LLDRKALQAPGWWARYRLERVEWPQGDSHTLSLYLKPASKVSTRASVARSMAALTSDLKVLVALFPRGRGSSGSRLLPRRAFSAPCRRRPEPRRRPDAKRAGERNSMNTPP
jgi:hypothetical protein